MGSVSKLTPMEVKTPPEGDVRFCSACEDVVGRVIARLGFVEMINFSNGGAWRELLYCEKHLPEGAIARRALETVKVWAVPDGTAE